MSEVRNIASERVWSSKTSLLIYVYAPYPSSPCLNVESTPIISGLPYRADEHATTCRPGTIADIFDGLHYCSLLGEQNSTLLWTRSIGWETGIDL
jgi:hypothetical protein